MLPRNLSPAIVAVLLLNATTALAQVNELQTVDQNLQGIPIRTLREQQLAIEPTLQGSSPIQVGISGKVTPSYTAISAVEQTIRQANAGEPFFRRPVPMSGLMRLQATLGQEGRSISLFDLKATVDYASALMRESPAKSLNVKLAATELDNRPAFHGNVAEFAEARDRGNVLTKDSQSESFDLTEDKPRPRSAQLKIYQDPQRGLDEVIKDMNGLHPYARKLGIMPESSLRQLETRGVVVRRTILGSDFYVPVSNRDVVLMPSKAFASTADSHAYSKRGRMVLADLQANRPLSIDSPSAVSSYPGIRTNTGSASSITDSSESLGVGVGGMANIGFGVWMMYETAPATWNDLLVVLDSQTRSSGSVLRLGEHGSFFLSGSAMAISGTTLMTVAFTSSANTASSLMAVSRWAGRFGVVMIVAGEGFMVWQYFDGNITGRQLATSTASLAGGVVGGGVGAVVGGWVGGGIGLLGGPFAEFTVPAGIFVGGAAGGFVGGYGGSAALGWATDSYCQFKDDEWGRKQRGDVLRDLAEYYGNH